MCVREEKFKRGFCILLFLAITIIASKFWSKYLHQTLHKSVNFLCFVQGPLQTAYLLTFKGSSVKVGCDNSKCLGTGVRNLPQRCHSWTWSQSVELLHFNLNIANTKQDSVYGLPPAFSHRREKQ